MPKEFVLAGDGNILSGKDRDKVTQFLTDKKIAFWHWYSDLWILTELADAITPKQLHTELTEAIGPTKMSFLIFELNGDPKTRQYWGNTSKEGWEWMYKYWGRPRADW